MNCPSCGKRNPSSLSNCVHCDAFIGGKSNRSIFSSSSNTSSSQLGGSAHQQGAAGQYGFTPGFSSSTSRASSNSGNSAAKMGLVVIAALFIGGMTFLYPEIQRARGKVENYILVWCVTQGAGVTTPAELEAQGFVSAPHRPTMRRHDRDSLFQEHYFCYEKDYGPNKPEHGAMRKHSEYREIHRYFTDP